MRQNHYYPYGLKHQNYNVDKLDYVEGENGYVLASESALQYKYKFNGQEWQEELGLNTTAMDFRQYDNAIGRFNGIDVLAETMYSITPYHFSHNNPVFFSDPTGLASNLLLYDFEGQLHVVTPDQYVNIGFSNDSEQTSAGAALEYLNNSFGGSGGNVSVATGSASPGPSGLIIFRNLSPAQLNFFLVILETVQDGKILITPKNDVTYNVDGFFTKKPTVEKYWYKTGNGNITTVVSEGSIKYSVSTTEYSLFGYISVVGWQHQITGLKPPVAHPYPVQNQ